MSEVSSLSAGVKRSADFQLTKENIDHIENKDNVISGSDSLTSSESSGLKIDGNDSIEDEVTKRRKITTKTNANSMDSLSETAKLPAGQGFLAYANTNPFASTLTANSGFGNNGFSSNSGGFGAFSSSKSTSGFGTSGFSTLNQKGLKVETKPSEVIVTPVLTPSPKVEKVNPFSSISPKLNPFMKIVESKEEPFLERSTSQSSQSSIASSNTSSSSKPSLTTIPTKSFFTTFKDTKSLSSSTTTTTAAATAVISTHSSKSVSPTVTSLPSATSDKNCVMKYKYVDNMTNHEVDRDDDNDDDNNDDENKLKDRDHREEGDNDVYTHQNQKQEEEEEADGPTLSKIYHLPETVVVLTGEENEDCFLQFRAKLYRLIQKTENQPNDPIDPIDSIEQTKDTLPKEEYTSTDSNKQTNIIFETHESKAAIFSPSSSETSTTIVATTEMSSNGSWIEVGVGPVRFLREKNGIPSTTTTSTITEESQTLEETDKDQFFRKVRIVMRREEKKGGHGTKLLLNIPLQGYISCARQGDKAIRITCVHPEMEGKAPSPQMYVLKTKSSMEADDAWETIRHCVEEAKAQNY